MLPEPRSETEPDSPHNYSRREFLARTGSSLLVSAVAQNSNAAAQNTAQSSSAMSTDLCFMNARELARLIAARKISAREVMSAYLQRIARLNPKLIAIVAKLDDDACLRLADEADQRIARGDRVGPLHGLPFAFKDNDAAVGFPFTNGSVIFKDRMPKEDSVVVERIRRAGVIPIGKTNVPEFALGSHTYNKVYGTTRNPYDLRKSAGGSSGGAAAALAAGLLPLANGSDTGGSLRNPANFNNVVGLRPTAGLVPTMPTTMPFVGLGVKGPLGRTVEDVALLLSVMAGPDARDPGCYPSDPAMFAKPLQRNFAGVRVAWCPDLGGLPLDAQVRSVLEAQRKAFEALGCIVEDAAPNLSDADDVFLTLRHWRVHSTLASLLPTHRDAIKPEALSEVDAALKLTGVDIAKAMTRQAEIMERTRVFQEQYEFIMCAVNQIPPFDAGLDWPKEIAGVKMDHYIAWMKSAYLITVTQRPAISVPAGFTTAGLPVGIQIVGRHRADYDVLQMAHAFEQTTRVGLKRPKVES